MEENVLLDELSPNNHHKQEEEIEATATIPPIISNHEEDIHHQLIVKKSSNANNITNLDHDSLENILSYCPNRASYEMQSLKACCRTWNSLMEGSGIMDNPSTKESISKSVKESIRSTSLLHRIEEAYMPRLFFHIFVPFQDAPKVFVSDFTQEDILEDRKPSVVEFYCRAFNTIFGSSFRKISDSEIEIDFEMGSELLEDMEKVIHREVAVPKNENLYSYLATVNARPSDEEAYKLFHVVKNAEDQEKKLKKHISLINLYENWKSQPFMDKDMKVNPCRLTKKVILHLRFEDSNGPDRSDRISTESTIFCTKRRRKGFFISETVRDEINLYVGSICNEHRKLYKFMSHIETYRNNSLIIAYYLLRHKIIPRMDEFSIDLTQLYSKSIVNDIKLMDREDVYYYLTVRNNIIKKYRDGLLRGSVKFPHLNTHRYFKINGGIIPEFLIYASLETMNDKQRVQFIKQFFKHIYNSDLLLSDEKRQEFFEKFKIDHRNELFSIANDSESIKVDFEKITFKRERAIFDHHLFSFPSFPSVLIGQVKEDTSPNENMTELTAVGVMDSNYRRLCCLSRICALCNCCAITSCWCATCCCCYSNEAEGQEGGNNPLGLPKWLLCIAQCFCRFEHKFIPMLDCDNCFHQCVALKKGDELKSEFKRMYP
ncbi:hypothetical protein NAEGRDRAFT_52651 [Naegleria gruberi]|uniref:Uncharacterized protein n=1 Tax=Naegleria gruberi TaxID=5762 RepID=D2VVR8_NAEGR|nr:uncharacterized protein NAEGRDRAFT_52651 [Naegleria gruberi]EFC39155.1 hypothetical protein NAEGRDRAFT_52651 [Naegleria gruberi]|eukprot:XP_002671899.1 hypothetical protein NAEGRDRAFT_52651 [Naegleria gruberi strain NEG-M]